MDVDDAIFEIDQFIRDPAVAARIVYLRSRPQALAVFATAGPSSRSPGPLPEPEFADPDLYRRVELPIYSLLQSDVAACHDLACHLLQFAPERDVDNLLADHVNAPGYHALVEYLFASAWDGPDRPPKEDFGQLCRRRRLPSQYALDMGGLIAATVGGGAASSAPSAQAHAKTKTVIVHGTFAATKDWWRDNGTHNFWDYLHTLPSGVGAALGLVGAGHEFTWSGGNSDSDRRQGAQDFMNWVATENPGSAYDLQVIAHSHGANVVYHALAMNPGLKLKLMIALGAPVRIEYPPRLDQIKRLYNVYSEHDRIQVLGSVGGQRGEGRTLADSSSLTNLHTPYASPKSWGVSAVGHSDLHEKAVWQGNRLAQLVE